MNTTTTQKKLSKPKVKMLGVINGDVKCWFEKGSKTICFRRRRCKQIDRISTETLYDKICGQLTMPFV